MALILNRKTDSTLPVEVQGIVPAALLGKSQAEISKQPIWMGRKQLELGELFKVSGNLNEDLTLVWNGDLRSVHWIGAEMTSGNVVVQSACGRHLGDQMAGGTIVAEKNASDFVGCEMRGGTIQVHGDAGNHVGGCYPGSKFGMNRGNILISGNAGKGVGQSMRRGCIAIGGSTDRLTGWDMLAGSILVFGKCGPEFGCGMIRGTLMLAGGTDHPFQPTFSRGEKTEGGVIVLLANWLRRLGFQHEGLRSIVETEFSIYHGDLLLGGRGEVFI